MKETGLIIIKGRKSIIESRGVERIVDHSPIPVDILHYKEPESHTINDYAWTVVIEKSNDKLAQTSKEVILEADAWEVRVSDREPWMINIKGCSERAELYALYHIAKCLEKGLPPSEWTMNRCPLVPHRYAWITAGNVWREVYRPDLFNKDIVELPEMGFNGVMLTLTPTHCTSIGRQTIPFKLTDDGVAVDRFKLPAFLNMFNWLKSYGLEISILHQAFIPPSFTREEVREYYKGQRILHGFEDAVEKSSFDMAAAIFTHLPQVDSLLHHSLECEWMWGDAVSIFPYKNAEIAERSFEAYLNGLSRACREFDKDLLFWTHISPVPARDIKLMHKILARYPEVVLVESHFLPDNQWPFAPLMGHLTEDMKADMVKRRIGLSIHTTDGEYYGAGALPTAYPEPHSKAAKEAVKNKAEYTFIRLNEQSLTPLGTLEDINTIHVLAASEQWWDPACSIEQLWTEWCNERFGKDASSAVISALKKSKIIITRGLGAAGLPLIDHSGLLGHLWKPETGPCWRLFDIPGELLTDKSYDELSNEWDFRTWIINARGIELKDFLKESKKAEEAAHNALKEIDSVRNCLKAEDFKYLTQCYEDVLVMIEAVRLTATAARALSVYLKDKNESMRKTLIKALADMNTYAKWIEKERGQDFRSLSFLFKTRLDGKEYKGYSLPVALKAIAEEYQSYLQL